MNKRSIPENWVWTTIGACASVFTGKTPSKRDDDNYGGFLPLVKLPELLDCAVNGAADHLSRKGAESARILPVDSVLVSCIGNLGKTGINRVPVAFNQQINGVVLPDEVIAEPCRC